MQANGRASGPVLPSVFLAVIDHSVIYERVDFRILHIPGTLVATGSEDASIKILDIGRMMAKANLPPDMKEPQKQSMETHPVIRTLYDHNAEVTCVEFHPTAQILASGGRDYTLKVTLGVCWLFACFCLTCVHLFGFCVCFRLVCVYAFVWFVCVSV